MTVNSKEENSEDVCPNDAREFGLGGRGGGANIRTGAKNRPAFSSPITSTFILHSIGIQSIFMQQKVKSDTRERTYWAFSVCIKKKLKRYSKEMDALKVCAICVTFCYIWPLWNHVAFLFYFVFGSSFAFFNSTNMCSFMRDYFCTKQLQEESPQINSFDKPVLIWLHSTRFWK